MRVDNSRLPILPLGACAAAALVGLLALWLRTLPAHAATAGATIEVAISKFAFVPQEVTIAPGTKVVWTNRDETPHTVTSSDKSFASKGMDTDDKYEHAFDREGDFSYICTVHPFMTGVVHVRKP